MKQTKKYNPYDLGVRAALKLFITLLAVILFSLPSFARDFTYTYAGQTLTYTVIDEEARTCMTKEGSIDGGIPIQGREVVGELIIPSKVSDGISEFTVISIGDMAFCYCSELTSW